MRVVTPVREILSPSAIFHQVAAVDGGRTAIRCGATATTYTEVAQRAGGIATWLREKGIGRGDIVATLHDRSDRPVVSMLAVWAVGAAYVHLDPSDPDRRLMAMLETVRPSALLADSSHQRRIPDGSLPSLAVDDGIPLMPYEVEPDVSPEDLAYLVFTSGSTGSPKAVAVEHRAVLNHHSAIRRFRGEIEPGSFGLTAAFTADFGLDCVFGALFTGGRLDVYSPRTLLDPVAFAAELASHPVDALVYTPTLLEALSRGERLERFLPSQMVIVAGESFPPRLARAILRARPDLPTFNSYGPSEATIEVMQHRVRERDVQRPRIPIGRPLEGVTACVLDENGAEVPDGVSGVLHLGGQCLARGYYNDPDATSGKFIVAATGERLYRTDDIVIRNADGDYEFLNRADRQLKIRGHRVEPGEVEAALLGQPEVVQALVVPQSVTPDAPPHLVAYVVTEPAVRPEDLTVRLRAVLPSALVPSHLHTVPFIPLGPTGKADLTALHAMIAQVASPGAEVVRTSVQLAVAKVWCAVLGRAEIGLDERFLEAGGDSLKALQVFADLRREFPDITIAHLFTHPTIATLAQALDGTETPRPAAHPTVVGL
ncbi:AMP-binding protein [Amycolatopsis orientalis]|uniref:AMP-binding protein n=1 Tax=Amycolatopsis orientalis TaxID=31958 RepID=A0A193BUX6_AMYOR|nr:non-ribosomal peptide synthetase [Amycolatopsis orientalis]ANN16021.1 AMP-binding protein [Amycolatopsis orientalis]